LKNSEEAYLKIVPLVILVVVLISPTLVRAANYNVGVKVGGWVKYGQVAVTWSGNVTEPSYVTDEEKIDWLKMEVESISGTTVSFNVTVHLNNGTQTPPQSSDIDVTGNAMSGIFLIASNLKSGDPITTQPSAFTINETTTGRYAGASRSVNVFESTSNSSGYTSEYIVHWDQSTGIMVELYVKQPVSSNSSAYWEESLKATETTLWSADTLELVFDNLIYIITGIVLVIIVIAVVIVLRRKKSPPPTPPTPPTSQSSAADTKQE
jgi:hypothetical protein